MMQLQIGKLAVFLFVALLVSFLCAARFPQALLLGSHSTITVMKCGTDEKPKAIFTHLTQMTNAKYQRFARQKAQHGHGKSFFKAHPSKHSDYDLLPTDLLVTMVFMVGSATTSCSDCALLLQNQKLEFN